MTFKMTDKARTLKVYNLLEGTNEYIGVGDAYIPPFTGLPANCTEIETHRRLRKGLPQFLTSQSKSGALKKIIVAKRFTAQKPVNRCSSLNLARCPKM